MIARKRSSRLLKLGMLLSEATIVVGCIGSAIGGIFISSLEWKLGNARDTTIMNIRNCQQAMRGNQNMKQLNEGDGFTRKDLEEFMQFSEDIQVMAGLIDFEPGDSITPESADPAVNGDHLWLQLRAPGTHDYVGRYGFNNIADMTGW